MKGQEDELFDQKITELTTIDESGESKMAHIETSDGSKFDGKIVDVTDDEITIKTFDNKTKIIKKDDAQLITSVMSNLANKVEMFPKIAEEQIPLYNKLDSDVQSALTVLAVDDKFDLFVDAYMLNTLSTHDTEGSIGESLLNFYRSNLLKIPNASNEMVSFVMSYPMIGITDLINKSSSPDQYIDQGILEEAKKAFFVLKDSPNYYVSKLSNDQISSSSEELFFDKLLSTDVDSRPTTKIEIADSFEDWKKSEFPVFRYR